MIGIGYIINPEIKRKEVITVEEYISPAMVKLTGEQENIGEAGAAAVVVIVIGLAWAWY
jgi:hypothetical protein